MNDTDLGLLVIRLVVGLIFAVHGAQKAFGWWAGPGWAGWVAVMDRLLFRPAGLFAAVSMLAELLGGLLLAAGLLTPRSTMMIIGQSVMSTPGGGGKMTIVRRCGTSGSNRENRLLRQIIQGDLVKHGQLYCGCSFLPGRNLHLNRRFDFGFFHFFCRALVIQGEQTA